MLLSDFLILTTELDPKLKVYLTLDKNTTVALGAIETTQKKVILKPAKSPFTLADLHKRLITVAKNVSVYTKVDDDLRLIFGVKIDFPRLLLK